MRGRGKDERDAGHGGDAGRDPSPPDPWQEVDAELAFHREMTACELEAAGLDRASAWREAERRLRSSPEMRRTLARLARQRDRSRRWRVGMDELRQDGRHAIQQLVRSSGFALLAIVMLALGIGSTTAIFSVVNAVILRPLPYPEPDRLVEVSEIWQGVRGGDLSAGNYVDARSLTTSFEAMAAGHHVNLNLVEGDAPERVLAWAVTHDWFEVFGVRPALGRTFTESEDAPGSDGVVVLSHGLWSERFGADPDIVGTDIRLGDRPRTVIGVMPEGFDPFEWGDRAWVPVAFTPERRAMHDEHYLLTVARLRGGVTLSEARADLERAGTALRERFPKDNAERSLTADPLTDVVIGDTARTRLLVLLGAVTLVLLIACGNVANLLLARGASRAREMAVRGALGASRGRVVRQLVTESAILALVAALVGAMLAGAGIWLFRHLAPAGIPRLDEAGLDGVALLFALGAATLSTVLAGLAPALRAARIDPGAALKEGPRGATMAAPRDRLRLVLVAAEVALALTLLVGAGLLIRSAIAMQGIDAGFDVDRIMTARVTFPPGEYGDGEGTRQAFMRIAEELDARAGIRAAVVSQAPLGPGGNSNGLVPEGRPMEAASAIDSRLRVITPGYFETMGVRLEAGRPFDERDAAGADLVMIVSETLARIAWPDEDPIGRRVVCCEGSPEDPKWKTVVGVAADVRSRGPAEAPRPEFYLPITQAPSQAFDWIGGTMTVVVRPERGDPADVVPVMRDVVRDVAPTVPLHSISSMSGALRSATAANRFSTQMLVALGVTGLVLAIGGIYGVVSFFVGLRRYEIGVRMALGASRTNVVSLVVRQGAIAVLAGIVFGTAASLAFAGVLRNSLVGVEPHDAPTYIAAAFVMLVVGSVAALLPARTATRVQPARALDST